MENIENIEKNPWQTMFERERTARKESDLLLEEKKLELYEINQKIENQISERTDFLKNALIKAEKVNKTKFNSFFNISHELKLSLSAILEYSQHLTNSSNLNKDDKKFALMIESNTNSLLCIINEFLANSLNYKEEKIERKAREDFSFFGKILVVEDNLLNQKVMTFILQKLDLNFEIASNGQEALDIYYERNSEFDLILMDINMPVLNGAEAFFEIRNFEEENFLKEIPIIALTANAIKGDRERYISIGMNDYLSKPVEIEELKKIISKYLKEI